MNKIILPLILSLLPLINISAQNIGINATGAAPATSAGLDISFTNKGLLIPRVALTATNSSTPITSPATSLLVYNTATAGASPNNVTPGYYYWDGSKWIAFGGSGGKDWSLTGNAGTTVGTNYIGTSDAKDLVFKTNANEQMRINTSGFLGINEINPTGAYLVVRSGNSGNDGIKATHTSSSTTSAFNAVSGTLTNAGYTNATGYLGYHNSNNKTYSIYGIGGDLAGYFDGRVAINSVSTDITSYDLEVRDKGTTNPVDVLFRRKDLVTVANTELTNLDFGDNTNALAQASLKVIREFSSSGATDLPTAFTFSTMADATNVLTERMRLNNAGFLGIGTTNPLQKLHVADDIILGGGQSGTFDGNTEHLKIWAQSAVWNVGVVNDASALNSDFFISRTDGTNDATFNIDPNGMVGIGTTATATWTKLYVYSNDADDALFVDNVDLTSNTSAIFRVDANGGTSNSLRVQRNGLVGISTGAPVNLLSVNGSAGKPGGGSWATFSDKKLKNNINDFKKGLDVLENIHVVSYQYNDKYFEYFGESEDVRNSTYYGVVAQELKKVAPFMVQDKEVTLMNDDEKVLGNKNFLQVDPSAFTYMLINAVKELKHENDLLKNRLDALEKKIDSQMKK